MSDYPSPNPVPEGEPCQILTPGDAPRRMPPGPQPEMSVNMIVVLSPME